MNIKWEPALRSMRWFQSPYSLSRINLLDELRREKIGLCLPGLTHPGYTTTKDGWKLEILDLRSKET